MFSKTLKKLKQPKNKTKKQKYNLLGGYNNNNNSNNSNNNNLLGGYNNIWDNYGRVLNTKTNKYIRLGSNKSMRVINELEHNDEWKKRVEYIINNHGVFGKKLEKYLQKKEKKEKKNKKE
jgi:hypothetical protein